LGTIRPDGAFLSEVVRIAGPGLMRCFQCTKCSSGCPVAFAMDITPNRLIRLIQYGQKETVLGSQTIWVCASCQTCTTRCPNGVDVAGVMDACREIAMKDAARGVAPSEPSVAAFHKAFLANVARFGRVHELSMVGSYKMQRGGMLKEALEGLKPWREGKMGLAQCLKTSAAFADMRTGLDMWRRGKLKTLPAKIKGLAAVKGLFGHGR